MCQSEQVTAAVAVGVGGRAAARRGLGRRWGEGDGEGELMLLSWRPSLFVGLLWGGEGESLRPSCSSLPAHTVRNNSQPERLGVVEAESCQVPANTVLLPVHSEVGCGVWHKQHSYLPVRS